MSQQSRPIDHLRDSVEILVRERDAAQEAFDSGRADVERLSVATTTAKEHLTQVERAHASRLAESHVRKDPEVEATLSDAGVALDEARRSLWTAQADREQAVRALEILRSELADARARLAEGATRAKQAAVAELLERAKVAWTPVRTLVDEVEATRLVEHGQDPPEVALITAGAQRFEREVLEGKQARSQPSAGTVAGKSATTARQPVQAGPTVAPSGDRSSMMLRSAVTVAGAASLITGALLEWLRPFDASGLDVQFRAIYASHPFEGTPSGQISAGAVMIILAGVALVGLLPRARLLTPLAGGLAVVSMVAYIWTVGRSDVVSFPSDVGLGAWLALGGGVILVAAGFIPVRRKPASTVTGVPAAEVATVETASADPSLAAAETATATATATAPAPAPVGSASPVSPVAEPPSQEAGKRPTVAWLVAGVAILLLVAAVGVRNSQPVEADLWFRTVSVRLIWAVPLLVGLGAVIGSAFAHPRAVLASLPAASEAHSRQRNVVSAIIAFACLALLVVAIQNTQQVEVDVLFTTVDVSLTWVILGSLAVGILVGAVAARRGVRVLVPASSAR